VPLVSDQPLESVRFPSRVREAAAPNGEKRKLQHFPRHPGEGRDLAGTTWREVEIPAFAGMTYEGRFAV
jgi:hypothetical protein